MKDIAIVYCEGAFQTANGKTAHGLVRFTRRYQVVSVIDSQCAGKDAGLVLDGVANGIEIDVSLNAAMTRLRGLGQQATHFVIGLAPDGGRLPEDAREQVLQALNQGLSVDSGLHDFLSDDASLTAVAEQKGVTIRDIRKPPDRSQLHFFSGRIEQVTAFKVAVLGTDSAVGKRTTAWRIVQEYERREKPAELIGTGQTAWLQGARFSLVLDSLVNDFVSGEIEHAVWSAWSETNPDVIVIEGQGSLLNPAYPGGFEILAAGRPDVLVLQHAPMRRDYDGFPGYPLHPLPKQIEALEIVAERPVAAIALNHEGMKPNEIDGWCQAIERITGIPTFDVLTQGAEGLVSAIDRWQVLS